MSTSDTSLYGSQSGLQLLARKNQFISRYLGWPGASLFESSFYQRSQLAGTVQENLSATQRSQVKTVVVGYPHLQPAVYSPGGAVINIRGNIPKRNNLPMMSLLVFLKQT
jgi:hypothetical protein